MYLVFVFLKGQYGSKYGSKSDRMKKAEKQNNPNRGIYCDVKSTLNVSVSITIIRTLISGKLFTQRWILVEITGATIYMYKNGFGIK